MPLMSSATFQIQYQHDTDTLTSTDRPIVLLLLFRILFCFVEFGTFQINFFSTNSHTYSWLHTHTFRARLKWMRNVIIINGISIYYRMSDQKNTHTRSHSHNGKYSELIRTFMANERIFTGNNSRLLSALFDLIWYYFFIAFVSMVLLGKNYFVIATYVRFTVIRSRNFEKFATQNGS